MTKRKCSRIGCVNDASVTPMLSFKGKNTGHDSPRGRVCLDLPLCQGHADPDPAQYVNGDGWAAIVASVVSRRMREPDRATLQVGFVPLPGGAS